MGTRFHLHNFCEYRTCTPSREDPLEAAAFEAVSRVRMDHSFSAYLYFSHSLGVIAVDATRTNNEVAKIAQIIRIFPFYLHRLIVIVILTTAINLERVLEKKK